MPSSRYNNRGRDDPDTGLKRTPYIFKSSGVEPEIRRETAGNDATIGHNAGRDIRIDREIPLDVSDAKRQPSNDPDLADLAGQNNGSGHQPPVKTWPPVYTKMDLAFSIFSLIMFVFDLGTDVALLINYHVTDQYLLRNLTLGFILVPSVVSCSASIVWSYIDYRNQSPKRSMRPMVIRSVFTLFQLGRVYRMVEFIYHMRRTWQEQDPEKVKDISLKAIEQKRDAAIMDLLDSFLESALQLMLQIYLLVHGYVSLDALRVFALTLSWFSTALTVTSYYRTVRQARIDRDNVRYGPSALYMAYRLFELGPRLLLLGLCVSYFRFYLLGGVVVHMTGIFLMNFIFINPSLTGVCQGQICRTIFLLLISFISVFCFINLKDGKTRQVMACYYAVFYLENFAILCVLVSLTQEGIIFYSPWYFTAYSVIPGFVLHMLCLSLYYIYCHPQKTRGKKQPYKTSTELIPEKESSISGGPLRNISSPDERS